MASHLFISHSSQDDGDRQAPAGNPRSAWASSVGRFSRADGGDALTDTIKDAIRTARHFLVVFSPHAFNSPWVPKETRFALEVAQARRDGYKVIPVLLPGVDPDGMVAMLFPNNPLYIRVEEGPTGLTEAIPSIAAALGLQLPNDWQQGAPVAVDPVEELLLTLTDPHITEQDGIRRAAATAELTYLPADNSRAITSRRYRFEAPIGVIELDDIRWYLEKYYLWPTGNFKNLAKKTEQNLPIWGKALYDAALSGESAREPLAAWRRTTGSRRFSVQVDGDPLEGTPDDEAARFREAANDLLTLPWEILHDGDGYLSQGANGVRVRRRLPNRKPTPRCKRICPFGCC
jgi:hypothetical protein